MATYGQIVHMCLDILKERSDDAYYTEEHMLFLARTMRAVLLERKYKKSRNKSFESVGDQNTQEICLDLEPTTLLGNGCASNWLKSIQEIPDMLDVTEPRISTVSEMLPTNVTLIAAERMPYVGHNKWLKNIIYAAIGSDDHLYLTSSNSQFRFLNGVKFEGVFADPEEAEALSCDANNSGGAPCDIMDKEFPLEEALIPSCIELIVQEIVGSRYAPEDKQNNAKDDLAEFAMNQRPGTPVENAERHRERYVRDDGKE